MKPSERIMEICKELNEKDSIGTLMGGFIRMQAILDYLDERYEKDEEVKEKLKNFTGMQFTNQEDIKKKKV